MLIAEKADYGTKTSALCTSTETLPNLWKVKASEYWGYAKKGHFSTSRLRQVERRLNKKIQVPVDPVRLWNAAFLELGGKHPNVSTGVGALIIALELKKPEVVYLGGFDKVLNPETKGYRSTVPTSWNADGQKDTGHDWATEKVLLGYLQTHYNVPIKNLAGSHLVSS